MVLRLIRRRRRLREEQPQPVDAGTEASEGVSVAGLVARRRAVRRWWEGDDEQAPEGLIGLALSGGGIRSATFSLGLIEGLAKSTRDALARVDLLSTVSGGGYIGCFLRSLFVPDEGRGIAPSIPYDQPPGDDVALDPEAVADQYHFARRVLASDTSERDLNWETLDGRIVARRNPLWWLREHSRYLAPNGPTDFGYAVAYIARNWVAMLYIFLLASFAISSLVVMIEGFAASQNLLGEHWGWISIGQGSDQQQLCGKCVSSAPLLLPVSPLFLLLVIPGCTSVLLSVAYWMTERMSPNEPEVSRQWANLLYATGGALVAVVVITIVTLELVPEAIAFVSGVAKPTSSVFPWLVTAGLVIMVLAAFLAIIQAVFLAPRGVALTSELRRHLTNHLATSNLIFLMVAAAALVDTLGAGLAYWLKHPHGATFGALPALLPVFAYVIKKLPDWFGGPSKGSLFSLLQRFISTIALVAGFVLFGAVAVAAACLVHLVAWSDTIWAPPIHWSRFGLSAAIVWILAILSGWSDGFINLSSLHFLYASRLTRAYLGASNNARLEGAASYGAGGNIKENHRYDYIQPRLYSRVDLPAPVHIINTTVNETIDAQSQLVARDRKGEVLSLEPRGVSIGRELVRWDKIGTYQCAEQLSLGQWCAISGAAASSAMGRLTNLGFALAFTFANVRLGYWWWSPGVRRTGRPDKPVSRAVSWIFGTFIYLFNEMTARYSLAYVRKYLTDGGHFENSGAYRLIEARVPLILVSDNGADPEYRFQDLENLVRTVRLDFGFEIELLSGADLREFLEPLGCNNASIFVDAAEGSDWRLVFADKSSPAFALVFRIRTLADDLPLHLIWIKPRQLVDMPADLLGYAADNPAFPQQPTGDQFFDESQWESYRKLGELSMTRLLDSCPGLLSK